MYMNPKDVHESWRWFKKIPENKAVTFFPEMDPNQHMESYL